MRIVLACDEPLGASNEVSSGASLSYEYLVRRLDENGRDLVKQTRKQQFELARPMLESLVHEAVGVKIICIYHDISTVTVEEIVIFTVAEVPRFQ